MACDIIGLYDLQHEGFCNSERNKIVSELLLESFVGSLVSSVSYPGRFNASVGGVRQLLQFAQPKLDLTWYMSFGVLS
jgi:hypothetical protein